MRLIWILIAIQMVLAGCSQNGAFHVSQSVTPTDPYITPENPMVIEPRGENASPHVLGFLEISEGHLERNGETGELTFEARVDLKNTSLQSRWTTQTKLRGKLNVNGQGDLYPVDGDKAGDLPVRARVTCMAESNPLACDQAIIDVFVKEGEKIHAAQVLAELRDQVPPESFAPTPKEERNEGSRNDSSRPTTPVTPPQPQGPETNTDESASTLSRGGPQTRQSHGEARRRQAEKRQQEELLRSRMNPEIPPADPRLQQALERKAEEYRQRAEAEKLERERALQQRMNPEVPPADPRLKEALERKAEEYRRRAETAEQQRERALQQRMNPEAAPENPQLKEALERKAEEMRRQRAQAPRTTPKTSRLPRAAQPEIQEKTPVTPPAAQLAPAPRQIPRPTPPPVQPEPALRGAPTQEEKPEPEVAPAPSTEPEQNDDEMEPEGEDPTDRPSLFIGTLHESADHLFETDQAPPEVKLPDVGPLPTPRPNPPAQTVRPPSMPSPSASRPRDQVIGSANRGSLQKASDLTKRNRSSGFEILRTNRERHFGSHEMMEVIDYLAKYAKSQSRIGALRVGDLSIKSGGKIPRSAHKSHQNGLDADLGYPLNTTNPNPGFFKLVNGGRLDPQLKVPETWALFKAAWATSTVDRIFVDGKIKQALCAQAKKVGDLNSSAELLRRVRPTPGHATHFHLRIRCSKDQPRCRMMGDPPRGSGC